MARKTPTKGQEATTGIANDPDSRTGRLKKLGGSQSDHWNTTLATQAARAMWVTNSDAVWCEKAAEARSVLVESPEKTLAT